MSSQPGGKGDRSNLPERPEGCFAQIGPGPFSADWLPELHDLLDRLQDGEFSESDRLRLNQLLQAGSAQRQYFITYMDIHSRLAWKGGRESRDGDQGLDTLPGGLGTSVPSEAVSGQWSVVSGQRSAVSDSEIRDQKSDVGAAVLQVGAAVQLPHQLDSADPEPLIPPIIIDTSAPAEPPPFFALLAPGGWLFSYAAAMVLVGLAILGAWMHRVSLDYELAKDLPPRAPSVPRDFEPKQELVGRITGTADCRWANPRIPVSRKVALGETYVLSSGLVEISYHSGAKVILEGPCTYEVDSPVGGFLSLGKVTARVEKGSGARGQGSEHYPLSTIHYSLFAVRTPTAIVTDLGTEFGVEVDREGSTTSHVFRGSVTVRVIVGDSQQHQERVLSQNESARVESGGGNRVTVLGPSAKAPSFVREIPKLTLKTLDLADVVAGGDGFSGRRDAGIDSTTGRATSTPKLDGEPCLVGDGRYHRAQSLPLVDGVFIPEGRNRPVQVDSAGHVFNGFTNSESIAPCYVWALGPDPDPNTPHPTMAWLGGVDYRSAGHGLIFLHANNGVTFNLDAVRRANPACKLLRFRAVGGSTYLPADLWVLVDGKLRFQQTKIDKWSGPFPIAMPIGEKDRFLTLASTTNRADGIGGAWIIFGDPVLEMASQE